MYLTSFTVQNFLQLIFYLAVLVGILFITFYVTRWIAGYQKNQMNSRNFEVIETMKVSSNKFLQIVRVGKDDFYVIGIGKEEIHFLGKLDRSMISFEADGSAGGGFSDLLAYFKDKNSLGSADNTDKGDNNDED